jgi:hypothetical protein
MTARGNWTPQVLNAGFPMRILKPSLNGGRARAAEHKNGVRDETVMNMELGYKDYPYTVSHTAVTMYRYSKKQHTKSLLTMGCIRIGTLHDFRRAEHKLGIADPKEGQKEVHHFQGHLLVADSSDPALRTSKDFRALEAFGVILRGVRDSTFVFNSFVRPFDTKDCFILCSSDTLSMATMRLFGGADSCVQIIDIPRFYQLVTAALNAIRPGIFRGMHEVTYQDRTEQWDGQTWGCHPALIKEAKDRDQAEIRAIWQPRSPEPIQPIITGDYKLGALCREVLL